MKNQAQNIIVYNLPALGYILGPSITQFITSNVLMEFGIPKLAIFIIVSFL